MIVRLRLKTFGLSVAVAGILSSAAFPARATTVQPAAGLAPTGTLRAVFLATNPVQGRLDQQTGQVTGPVADLVRELAGRLHVPFTIIPVPDAAAVIASLKAHDADIGFLAFETARAAQVDFSDPYALMFNAYLVRTDSSIRNSSDADRAGITVGAVKGQSQEIYVSSHLRQARVQVLGAMPTGDALERMLLAGELDAFAANRQRMEEVARISPRLRVLDDNFLVVGQAIVVEKGDRASIDELNRFLADLRASGFLKASLARAKLVGVEVAPAPTTR
jgi:polar amino acid transport system substrate-binding protein